MAKFSSFLSLIISSGSLFFLFSSAPQSLNAQSNNYIIQLVNKCYDTVDFAINYVDRDGDRITRGWFNLSSRGLTNIAARSATFYYYAKSRNGKHIWTGNDLRKTVEGSDTVYDFRKGTPNVSGRVLRQSLTCE